jgi:hypothetical protein
MGSKIKELTAKVPGVVCDPGNGFIYIGRARDTMKVEEFGYWS